MQNDDAFDIERLIQNHVNPWLSYPVFRKEFEHEPAFQKLRQIWLETLQDRIDGKNVEIGLTPSEWKALQAMAKRLTEWSEMKTLENDLSVPAGGWTREEIAKEHHILTEEEVTGAFEFVHKHRKNKAFVATFERQINNISGALLSFQAFARQGGNPVMPKAEYDKFQNRLLEMRDFLKDQKRQKKKNKKKRK